MKKLIYIFFILFAINSFAQGEASKWYFGQGAAVDFNGGTPTNITGSQLNTNEGCSSFADSSGNLLFYIGSPNLGGENLTIWDRNNNPMPNGTGLEGDASSSQSALTVPAPGQTDIYYIFTVGANFGSNTTGFYYYTLDMTLNGGLGDIVGGATQLHFDEFGVNQSSSWTEKVTAVKGDECNTFWVVSQFNNQFVSYKVDVSGVVIGTPESPNYSTVDNAATDVRGYLKVSPNGESLVTAHYTTTNRSLLILYSFDNTNGDVRNDGQLLIDTNRLASDGSPYGVEFNNNSNKLYTSTHGSGFHKVFQFDLADPDVLSSKFPINSRPGRYRGALQLAQDGKIYGMAPFSYNNGTPFLDVIENPNDDREDVIYTEDAVNLGAGLAMQGLPPFISSIFSEVEITGTDSDGNTIILNDITLNLCTFEDLDIAPEPLTGTGTIAYNWYYNANTTPFASTPDISFTNVTSAINGTYKLVVNFTDACGDVTTKEGEFEIEVFDQPTATQPTTSAELLPVRLCDDDNNGAMNFDLSSQDSTILGTQDPTIFEVLYFTDPGRADADQIPRATPPTAGNDVTDYTNETSLTVSGIQPIYALVRNIGNTDCVADTSFDLEVYESAVPSTTVTLLADCDNTSVGTDADGFIEFNLHDRATEILGTQTTGFTLTYFTDDPVTNPASQIPVADETAFTNTVVGGQTIYVRMTNDLTAAFTTPNTPCFTDTSFEIEVYEKPVLLTPLIELTLCTDDLISLTEPFNLRLKEDELSANFAVETFTYYETPAEADAGIPGTEIATPTAYPNQVADFDTVWVRVETADGCHRVAQVDLDVEPSSAVMNSFVTREFSQCDDGADNRNGIATFDFSSVTIDIQNLFAPVVVDVLYYETEAQANQGLVADQLNATNYDNISQDQLIWVQIVSPSGSDCLAKGQYVQLHVESLPTANMPTTVMKECDDDGDGAFPFDVSTITSEILNGQSLADVTITYFNEDGSPITGVINSSLPNPFTTSSQTIDIVITNNNTNDPDGACSDTTTLEFIVDDSPINNVQPIPAECETDPEDGLLIATFDTSNFENSINAQAGMDITYLDSSGNPLQDMDGNPIVSPFPNSFTTETQTITVTVTNPANTTCPASVDVDFTVNPRPVFDDLDEEIVCENILPHLITVENPDASTYMYEWFNTSGISIGTDQTLSIIDATDISTTGVTYSVTATNPTTGCTRTKTVNLKKSSIATLLDADIVTIEFNSPTNSIEIITTNIGFGDYEFALEHDADARPWQDEPIFEDLQGGMYTVLINDKNDCGETSKVIFLLDYPKFLTPNNDGHNDYWQLIGLDSTTYTISPMQIFDRFGKIVAIINPTQGQGWDGFYNNKMLPSSDYWFALSLTNNLGETIVKRGNFSLIRR